MKKLKFSTHIGFTLSEVLISLAIIGIAAMLTLPTVRANYQKKTQVAGLQRVYTLMADSVKMLLVDERAKNVYESSLRKNSSDSLEDTAGQFLNKYFRVVKDCGTSPTGCFATAYTNLNGAAVTVPATNVYCVVIANGASICVSPLDENDAVFGTVITDVNGAAKPNISGRDLFMFHIYRDGFVGDRGSKWKDITNCKSSTYGFGCFNRIVNSDWKMDY